MSAEIRSQGDRQQGLASLASLESYLKKRQRVDLSENNQMWNSGFDITPDDGGNYTMATAYLRPVEWARSVKAVIPMTA